MNIFLIGFMGCGKSTIAKELRNRFGMRVLEMDKLLEEQEGMSVSEIFVKKGEAYFREKETQFLINMGRQKNCVVSCGGGVALRDENVREMKKHGRVVLLKATPETILERVKRNDNRPLLRGKKNVTFIAEMMEQRREKYEMAADIAVQIEGKTRREISDEIMIKLKEIGE